jgi:hypothetical protein
MGTVENLGRTVRSDRPVAGYAHIYSDGTNIPLLGQSRRDNIDLMNMLAVSAFTCRVRLLVICLMSTHFHVIAEGPDVCCHRFMRSMNRKLDLFISRKKLRNTLTGSIRVAMDPIHTETELMSKIIYVYRNPIAAGYPRMPWEYEWGSGDIYFVDHKAKSLIGRPLHEWTIREQRLLFHTHIKLPQLWRCSDEGLILPHSYLAWDLVEEHFKNPKIFLAFLHQKKDVEAAIDRECAGGMIQRASETQLRVEARETFRNLFGNLSYPQASLEQKMVIAQKLWAARRTFSLSILSRVTLVDKHILEAAFGVKK